MNEARARILERRVAGALGVLVFALALIVPAAWNSYVQSLGSLDLKSSREGSTIVVDREGRLLRAFTLPDGRWRLPVREVDVDPRYLSMLIAYEDRRFLAIPASTWTRWRVRPGNGRPGFTSSRRLDADDAGRAPHRAARRAHVRSQASADSARDADRAARRQVGRSRPLSDAGAFWRQSRGRALGFARLFRQRAAQAQHRGGGAAGRAAAGAEWRRPDKFPEAARLARARVLQRALARGVINADEEALGRARADPIGATRLSNPCGPCGGGSGRSRSFGARAAPFHRRAFAGQAQGLAKEGAARLGPKLSAAIVAIDNASGEIRARIGAADYLDASRGGAIDMSRAPRSPGSSLKPFIYALAFEQGLRAPEAILDSTGRRVTAPMRPKISTSAIKAR